MNLKALHLPRVGFGLAIHSTTGVLEIAIAQVLPNSSPDSDSPSNSFSSNKISSNYAHRTWDLGREISSQIHTCLLDFLREFETNQELKFCWNDIVWLAVARGIGSFTSTRVSMVMVRAIAQQLDLPVYALDCEAISTFAQNQNMPLGVSLLQLAQLQSLSGNFPHWSEALPSYGGDFGNGNI